jgi:hypothetical protein
MGRELSPATGTLTGSNTANPQQNNFVFGGQQAGVGEEQKERERTGSSSNAAAAQGEQGDSRTDMLLMQLIQSMQQQKDDHAVQARLWQQQLAEQSRQIAEQSRQIAELKLGRGTANMQAHSAVLSTDAHEVHSHAAAALRTPISTRVSGLYEQAERGAARTLFGQPTDGIHLPRQLGMEEPSTAMRVKDVLDMAAKFVKPFNGSTELDKVTVASFVLNVETVMGNLLPPGSPHRLMLVQMSLRDAALQWLDNHLLALKDGGRDLAQQPPRWDEDVRTAFIVAFTGADTVEVWLSQLSALRLGGEKTKTPMELNIQFDRLARHVYPLRSSNDDDLLLAQKYRDIVASSDYRLYNTIMTCDHPSTLKEWKVALALQWSSQQEIKAFNAQRVANTYYHNRSGGGWRQGRGGGQGSTDNSSAQTLHAMSDETGEGASTSNEGQPQTSEGQANPQQLAGAMGGGHSQRGGRGGRGGRGRGGRLGARAQWSEKQQKLFDENRCFLCEQTGHRRGDCPKAPASK